jgi:RHS repeat-associated protein
MTAPQFMRTASNQVYYYHNDHLGTPQELIDREGNIVWQAEYDAFGKATVKVNSVENNLRFPGQYFDAETGLHHNYMRDYDVESGRYIQADPWRMASSINYYVYAGQNPLRFMDSTGEFFFIPFIVAGLGRAVIGALGDIGIQLVMNRGRPQCIKWDVVAIAALEGVVNPFGFSNSISKWLKGTLAEARAAKYSKKYGVKARNNQAKQETKAENYNRAAMREAIGWGVIAGSAEIAGNVIPEEDHWRIEDDCKKCK